MKELNLSFSTVPAWPSGSIFSPQTNQNTIGHGDERETSNFTPHHRRHSNNHNHPPSAAQTVRIGSPHPVEPFRTFLGAGVLAAPMPVPLPRPHRSRPGRHHHRRLQKRTFWRLCAGSSRLQRLHPLSRWCPQCC